MSFNKPALGLIVTVTALLLAACQGESAEPNGVPGEADAIPGPTAFIQPKPLTAPTSSPQTTATPATTPAQASTFAAATLVASLNSPTLPAPKASPPPPVVTIAPTMGPTVPPLPTTTAVVPPHDRSPRRDAQWFGPSGYPDADTPPPNSSHPIAGTGSSGLSIGHSATTSRPGI